MCVDLVTHQFIGRAQPDIEHTLRRVNGEWAGRTGQRNFIKEVKLPLWTFTPKRKQFVFPTNRNVGNSVGHAGISFPGIGIKRLELG